MLTEKITKYSNQGQNEIHNLVFDTEKYLKNYFHELYKDIQENAFVRTDRIKFRVKIEEFATIF